MKNPFSDISPTQAQGFYWIRFEGALIVAEFTLPRNGCLLDYAHWHVPGTAACYSSAEVCERLGDKLKATPA